MEKSYIVKPEENLVVATLDRRKCKYVMEEVKEKCNKEVLAAVVGIINEDWRFKFDLDIYGLDTFKGIAKCVKGDKFDERVGKDVASNIVDKKYHLAMMRKYEIIIRIFRKAIKELSKLHNEHAEKVFNINEDMERHYSNRQIG